ncbi:MAG: hypothetical protein LBV06_04830 [Propionibacteriaceae bacterium]|nr:hypothetical protein [Propionibacteriaceae bacterium]
MAERGGSGSGVMWTKGLFTSSDFERGFEVKKKIISALMAVGMTLTGVAVGSAPQAVADNGRCGSYGDGFAVNDYCGGRKVTIAATKATWYYSAGQGGIGTRAGNYVHIGHTSYIGADPGDTGAYGCRYREEVGFQYRDSSCA